MICCKCKELVDFASNPIGDIVRLAPNDVRIYCKGCVKEIDNKLKNVDLTRMFD